MLVRNMRKLGVVLAVASLVGCGSGGQEPATAATGTPPKPIDPKLVPPTEIGMNIAPAGAFSGAPQAANLVMAHGSLWLVGPKGWDFDSKDIPRDAAGYPTNVPKGMTLVLMVRPHSDDRIFRPINCTMSPGWTVEALDGGRKEGGDEKFRIVNKEAPGAPINPSVPLRLVAKQDGVTLKADCREAGVPADALVDPQAVTDMRPFKVVRFMDWMATNNAEPRTWAKRPVLTDFAQDKGAAVEMMVELANKADVDPWFTLPFDADEAYYRNFATYVRDHLAPTHKVYAELSNEVWNSSFKQASDATTRGKAAYPGVDDQKANDYYYGDRVRAFQKIWSEVFAGHPERLVRVASIQAVWWQRADDVLGHKETWRSVDMLASAPYWGTDGFEIPTKDPKVRREALFAAGPKRVDEQIKNAIMAKTIAAKYGVRYGTYEGGPSYYTGNPPMQEELNALNRDPRIYDLYTLWLNRWAKEVGGLYTAYYSVGKYSGSGAWGHKEFRDATPEEAPKWRALTDFIKAHPGSGRVTEWGGAAK